jgi:hypothetical protein
MNAGQIIGTMNGQANWRTARIYAVRVLGESLRMKKGRL